MLGYTVSEQKNCTKKVTYRVSQEWGVQQGPNAEAQERTPMSPANIGFIQTETQKGSQGGARKANTKKYQHEGNTKNEQGRRHTAENCEELGVWFLGYGRWAEV